MTSSPTPHDPLLGWEDWEPGFSQKPTLLHELQGGRTNQSYLIEIDKQAWVLRRNNDNATLLGIDRQREATILNKVSHAGIAPEILYCSPQNGILIGKYIEGKHWQNTDSLEANKKDKLIELINKVHGLDIDIPHFDYLIHLKNYWQQLQEREIDLPDSMYEEYESISKWLKTYSGKRVLCHHDPGPQNIIESDDQLYLLDWEYAGWGWPGFDYAALSIEWQTASSMQKLSGQNEEDFQRLRSLYSHLCDVWALLRS